METGTRQDICSIYHIITQRTIEAWRIKKKKHENSVLHMIKTFLHLNHCFTE